ncbi:hypothetical protein CAPTEDRAFT_139498, partial [Capitella teleta]
LVEILPNRTSKQRQEIREEYMQKFGLDLLEDANRRLTWQPGPLKHATSALIMSPAQYDAQTIREAIKGPGTNEKKLNEILITRNKQDKIALVEAYKNRFKSDLEKDIKSKTSADYGQVCLQLLNSNGDTGNSVNEELAKASAADILQARLTLA